MMRAICYFCLFLLEMILPATTATQHSTFSPQTSRFKYLRLETHPLVSLVLWRVSVLPLHLFLELQGLKVQVTEGAG